MYIVQDGTLVYVSIRSTMGHHMLYCCPVTHVAQNYNGLFILFYSTWRGDSTNMFVSLDHSCFVLKLYVSLLVPFAFCKGNEQKD